VNLVASEGILNRAVILLSGGIDSATCLAMAISQGFQAYCLSVDYGQRHRIELQSASRIVQRLGAKEHRIVKADLRAIGGSALTGPIDVPKDRPMTELSHGIPVTYVPARNTILLGLALGYAETICAFDIFIGANVLDYSGYPDCRPDFLDAFVRLANLATKAGVEGAGVFRIYAPLLKMTKADIICEGTRLGLDYSLTTSCYDPDENGTACGKCDSCQLRKKGFEEAGVADPTIYGTGR
jgi:7-cyano-7-deazaguanine synthase